MRVVCEPVIALDAQCQLGESPVWDQRRGELVWVDITPGELRTWSPASGEQRTTGFDGELSAVILGADPGARVLAIGHRLHLERNGKLEGPLAEVEADHADNRFNDCRCDPAGRVWAGTMSRTRTEGTAALYRLEPTGGLDEVVRETTISNGIGWSPDQTRMYFVDSLTYRIDVFEYDRASGEVADRRPFATVDPADGLPDGLAVDAEGGVWVCLFGGGTIRRYRPDGSPDLDLQLPVTNPTCPAFGGDGLSTIYVTSARHRLSDQQLRREPHAGAVVALDSPVAGLPSLLFPRSWLVHHAVQPRSTAST